MQKGISLSEVLVGLFLSTLIISSLMQIYLSHKKHYLYFQSDLMREFEVNRATDLIRQSIRTAGFTPCLPLTQLQIQDRRSNEAVTQDLEVCTKPFPMLISRRMSENFSNVLQIQGARHVLVSRGFPLNARHPVIIADCHHAEIHQIEAIKNQKNGRLLKLKKPLLFKFDKEAYLGEWIEEKWLIRKNSEGRHALFFQDKKPEELSSFIIDMLAKKKCFSSQCTIDVQFKLSGKRTHHFITRMRNG